jgi:hypothetical protein
VNRNPIYIRVLLVLIALVILLAFLARSPRPSPVDPWLPSSFNPVGAGTMAFYQTLQDLNWPVERWREPLSRLAHQGTGNELLITRSREGARVSFSAQEIGLLESWVRQGNTLVLLGALTQWDDTRDLLRQFGFSLPEETGVSSISDLFHPLESPTVATIPVSPALGTGHLVIPGAAPLPTTSPPHSRILARQSGQPYLIDVPCGKGHVICGASARIISNAFLTQGANLPVILQLLAPGGKTPPHLFFEESHHGFSAIFAITRLLEHPGIRFGGMLALLGVLTFLGSSLIRFGPVLPPPHAHGRSTLEFVNSIADLYQRADLRNDMIAYLFRETHQRVLQRLHLPPTAPHDLISSRLGQAYPQLPKWKKLAQRFDSPDHVLGLPPSGWLRVARELIEIKSALV